MLHIRNETTRLLTTVRVAVKTLPRVVRPCSATARNSVRCAARIIGKNHSLRIASVGNAENTSAKAPTIRAYSVNVFLRVAPCAYLIAITGRAVMNPYAPAMMDRRYFGNDVTSPRGWTSHSADSSYDPLRAWWNAWFVRNPVTETKTGKPHSNPNHRFAVGFRKRRLWLASCTSTVHPMMAHAIERQLSIWTASRSTVNAATPATAQIAKKTRILILCLS